MYDIYSLFSNLSYKTILVEMSYFQNEETQPFSTSDAFFIEKDSKLAKRCNLKKAKKKYADASVGTWKRSARNFVFSRDIDNFDRENLANINIFNEFIENFIQVSLLIPILFIVNCIRFIEMEMTRILKDLLIKT
jgi:hypothetical protein